MGGGGRCYGGCDGHGCGVMALVRVSAPFAVGAFAQAFDTHGWPGLGGIWFLHFGGCVYPPVPPRRTSSSKKRSRSKR